MNIGLLINNLIPGKRSGTKNLAAKYNFLKSLQVNGPLSVAELSDHLHISTPIITKLITDLIKEGWVEKKGKGVSVGGRKPDLYGLKDKSFFIVCVDIELFHTRLAIIDNSYNFITPAKIISIPLSKSRDDFFTLLQTSVNDLLKFSKIDKKRLIGCSIGMPGLINTGSGENYSYLLNEKAITLRQSFETLFRLPVVLQNDVKGAALAELRHGHAKNKKNVLVLLMDWGVGLGIIMDGKVRQGSSGFSGEIGHIPFVENGELCYCGKRGCMETVASGLALSKMAKRDILSGKSSIISNFSNADIQQIEPGLIIRAANKGDQYAIQLLSDIGTNIGKGASVLIQLFNPELIILSGKIAEAKQYITLPMQQAINTYCMTQIREKVTILSSEHNEDFRLLGYAAEYMDQYFEALIDQVKKQ